MCMCNDDVNDPIPEHGNDDGTDPKSIQFACPEQIPPSTDEQSKCGRGRPHKPKSLDTGDKPKLGRGRSCKPTPPETSEKTKHGRGRPPKHKDPPVVMHLNQRSPTCITHVVLHSHR